MAAIVERMSVTTVHGDKVMLARIVNASSDDPYVTYVRLRQHVDSMRVVTSSVLEEFKLEVELNDDGMPVERFRKVAEGDERDAVLLLKTMLCVPAWIPSDDDIPF